MTIAKKCYDDIVKKQKGSAVIFILIGILVIAGVAGGAYYLGTKKPVTVIPTQTPVVTSQTPQPTIASQTTSIPDATANWNTYTNTQYGISFKYPDTWFFKDATQIAPGTSLVSIAFFKNGTNAHISSGRGDSGNELMYMIISNNLDGSQIVSITKDKFIQEVTTINPKNVNVTIDGHPASYDSNDKSYSIWYNDKIQISVSAWNDDIEAKNNIDTIISSLKFSQ